MPLENLGRLHFTEAQKTAMREAFDSIETVLASVTTNLTATECQRYGSVNETNKLLVNKARDYFKTQPQFSSPDIDWQEFEADYQDREFAATHEKRMLTLLRMLTDFKIVHDFDNYQNALVDYSFTQYKAGTKAPGFTQKAADMKQFFPNNTHTETPEENSNI